MVKATVVHMGADKRQAEPDNRHKEQRSRYMVKRRSARHGKAYKRQDGEKWGSEKAAHDADGRGHFRGHMARLMTYQHAERWTSQLRQRDHARSKLRRPLETEFRAIAPRVHSEAALPNHRNRSHRFPPRSRPARTAAINVTG